MFIRAYVGSQGKGSYKHEALISSGSYLLNDEQGKQCFQRCTRFYGNHHGNYHDNHSNHHGNYHAEQLLFSCQCSKVSSCRVVRLSSCQVRFLGTLDMLNKFFLCPCSNLTVYRRKWQWFLVPCSFRGL